MVISRKTLIKDLLKADKDAVIRQLTQLNSNFNRLRNPVLRNLLGRMVDIEGACKVAQCDVSAFLDAMQQIGFTVEDSSGQPGVSTITTSSFLKTQVRELDVRPALARKEDPLKIILAHIDQLRDEECLKLIAPFEPVPLIHMLNAKGYLHEVEQEEGGVVTYFKKDPEGKRTGIVIHAAEPASDTAAFESIASRYAGQMRSLDVRNLDMPQPMIQILDSLQRLPDGEALFVHHRKLPVYLLPHLQERGFEYVTQETAEGKLDLIIYKP